MIKVNIATTKTISCVFKFNYDKPMKVLFPTKLQPGGTGECSLTLSMAHKWKAPSDEDAWSIQYLKDFTMEDDDVEDQKITLNDVIFILVSIINYNQNNNIGIHIKNGGKEKLSINREFLNDKITNAYPFIVAYAMADLC